MKRTLHQKSYQLTRIAPTPSGYLHLGNVFSFAVTASIAETSGTGLLLRIDDMDSDRVAAEYIEDVFDTLRFLDIRWNMGPLDADDFSQGWSQHARLALYNEALAYLRSEARVYACRCSRRESRLAGVAGCAGSCRKENIGLDEPGVSWRVLAEPGSVVSMRRPEEVCEYRLPAGMHDFVVRRRDGLPAYHLCSVVDDSHFGVDLVVRGSDLFDSTLAQLFLARQLGLDQIANTTYVHHKLLLAASGEKLSKSAGDTSVQYLRKTGAVAGQVYELVARLAGIGVARHWRDITAGDIRKIT